MKLGLQTNLCSLVSELHPFARFSSVLEFDGYGALPISDICPPSSAQRRIFSIACLLLSDAEAGFIHASTLP